MFYYVAKVGFELTVLLSQPLECELNFKKHVFIDLS